MKSIKTGVVVKNVSGLCYGQTVDILLDQREVGIMKVKPHGDDKTYDVWSDVILKSDDVFTKSYTLNR